MDMNVGALISGQITSIAQSNSCRLGFPALITALCRARGVVSDSLTFERVRARPAELPSTSVAPTLASTSTASSVLAQSDSQHFEAMLQSIHQGQIILLQSLQVMAPPGSIPTVEQFLASVTWPGAQPSLHRENEGPTAQVPQHMEDESSEDTIPEPFIVEEEAGETQIRQEAAATPERSIKVTLEPPAPVVDLSSPQHVVDPSTPILEIPEDLTTLVLTLNTSPLATPVLHLTDEEAVQTQDTQDQSQEF
ncbi:hypothetical protein GmHk_08G023308 [Glycine max]|nr:hypothetical protein GmHk_08G023308 [Glycine max]